VSGVRTPDGPPELISHELSWDFLLYNAGLSMRLKLKSKEGEGQLLRAAYKLHGPKDLFEV
jgi:hypothetical protein